MFDETDDEIIDRMSLGEPKKVVRHNGNVFILPDPFLIVWRQKQFKLKLLIIICLEIIGIAAVLICGTEYQSLPSVSFLSIMLLIILTMLDWISKREDELGAYHLIFDRHAKYYFSKVWSYPPSSLAK